MPYHHREIQGNLRYGDQNSSVVAIRATLISLGLLDRIDTAPSTPHHRLDVFDIHLDHAVRAFQQQRGLLVDGIVGKATYRALKEASYKLGERVLSHQFGEPMHGDDVAILQTRLQNLGFYTGLVDGYFGIQTHNALTSYQHDYGLTEDGVCGPETLQSLDSLALRVSGGSPHAIREEEIVRRSGAHLAGKRIVIDPGCGGSNRGIGISTSSGKIYEAEILWDLSHRLEKCMTSIGMEIFLSHSSADDPTDLERAKIANSIGADLMISLRCGQHRSTLANGLACFYFGSPYGSVSTIGRNLADFIQREIVARTSFHDCRVHGRTWDILRLTQMPTVQVDLGYITNSHDQMILADPYQRDIIAEGILAAVKRLYLLGKNDRPTGTFTFSELLAHELSLNPSIYSSSEKKLFS